MTRRLLSATAAAALITTAPAAASAVVARANLQPRAILFADVVHAQVDVTVDRRLADPASIEITTPLGRWTQLARSLQTTWAGSFVRRRVQLMIACRTSACVPAGRAEVTTLPPATVSVRTKGGGTSRTVVNWPPLVVASRLPAGATTAARPPFQLEVTPPPPTLRASASGVALGLDLAAALCVLAALALGGVAFRGRRRRPAPRSALERALTLARESESRPAPDRRRALALLARVAPSTDGELAGTAAETAWSAGEPTPQQVERIARQTEQAAASGEPLEDGE
jgi:hypothetical protein